MMENQRVAESNFADVMMAVSPSFSSYSSSDLDTESTGSFFYDKSITLGSLMGLKADVGVSTRVIVHGQELPSAEPDVPTRSKQNARSKRSKSWWRLCRDNDDFDCHRNANPSLGHFLEVERRSSVSDIAERMYIDVVYDEFTAGHAFADRNLLFSEGRILPPQSAQSSDQSAMRSGRDSKPSWIPIECCFRDRVSRRSSLGAS